MLAPVVIFTYNRPEHTRRTMEQLMANDLADQSTLFIFADGPKAGISEEGLEKIKKTREVVRERQWCKDVHIFESEKNKGLAGSIIGGVTEVVNKYGKIIVLEDDLDISPNFLKYMNRALDRFEKSEEVMAISGYTYPTKTEPETDAFFLPFTSSLGWGTWKRVWDSFDAEMKGLKILEGDAKLRKSFDLDNAYPYYKMILAQKAGKVDSWAIRFYLSVFLQGGLTLFPKKALIFHAGRDGSGTHCVLDVEQCEIDPNFCVETFDKKLIRPKIRSEIFEYLKKRSSLKNKAISLSKYFLGIRSWLPERQIETIC